MLYLSSFIFICISILVGNAALALFLGIILASYREVPTNFFTQKYGSRILQTGIVFLGGSLSLDSFFEINSSYFLLISLYVITAFALVLLVGKLLGVSKKLSYLLGSGTAICGGTAIAAVGPAIKAKPEEFTTAITIVFLLNALAVILFPIAGDFFNLSEREFGAWVALAIHDTASVIGAASMMGDEAIEVAATLKVTRTLWIVPLVIGSAWLFRNKSSGFGLPLFVVFFLFATILNSLTNPSSEVSGILKLINEVCLLTGLFCIGTQINIESLKSISLKVFKSLK
ncbi:MAG: putative sulfate exporter family transporter [SAR86 cluster bacterium]|nr:putative sulfate exporter family transporter [SAR86 cluster bacterium]